jgi:heavy metal sensor kinase
MKKPRRILATIGARLTLWGVLTTLGVCVILTIVLNLGMRHFMLREADRYVVAELRELSAKVEESAGDYRAARIAIQRELGNRPNRDLHFRLLDATGRTLIRSDPARGFSRAYLRGLGSSSEKPRPITVEVGVSGTDRRFRAHSRRLAVSGREPLTAVVFYSLKGLDRSMAWLLRASAIGLLVAALISLVGNALLARQGLRPVAEMTAAADAIGENSLDARIERTGSDDELDRLAGVLNAMLDRVETHVEKLRQFTADASHELRSPLAALRGQTEVCLSKPRSNQELRDVLEASLEQFERLQHLTEDLLLLSRADARQLELDRKSVSLDVAVRDVVDLYRPLAVERGLDLDVSTLDEARITGDAGRLRQLLCNLLDNAIKFSPEPGRIEVSLAATFGDSATIQVKDQGVGIAPEDLPRVFDRFFRADRARKSGGVGLGLAISKWIAEAHGGRLEIESELGRGTSICAVLPRKVSV